MVYLLMFLGFLALMVFLCWANYKLEGARKRREMEEDPNLYAVANRAWESGKPIIGTVDDEGNLTMREVEIGNEGKEL